MSKSSLIQTLKAFCLLAGCMGAFGNAAWAQETSQSVNPAAAFAGNWTAEVKMTSTEQMNKDDKYWWLGKMWGRIDETGRFVMKAENGCSFEGLFTTRDSQGTYGQVKVSQCKEQSMNRVYSVKVNLKDSKALMMTFSRTYVSAGSVLEYAIVGLFGRY